MVTVCRPHILVVDDDPSIRDALRAGLAARYTVHTVATGGEAVALLQIHPIAAIVLDALLGPEHGLDFVERFRRVSSARIMLLTGHGSEELAMRAVWADVHGYLKKPTSLPALQEALERLLPPPCGAAELAARARRYLDLHFAQPIRIADVAEQLGVGEAQVRRSFRAAWGVAPHAYLRWVRLERAAVLLATTDRGIKEIAQDVGYASHTRFGKVFHRAYGVPPSAYRANASASRTGNRTSPAVF